MNAIRSGIAIIALALGFSLPNAVYAEGANRGKDQAASQQGMNRQNVIQQNQPGYIYDYDYYDAYDYGYDGDLTEDDWFYDYYGYGDAFSDPEHEYDYDWADNDYEWQEDDLFFDDDINNDE